jgi:hypothetical protein
MFVNIRYIYIPCIYEFTYYTIFYYMWIHLFRFYQAKAGAKLDLHDVFEEESQQRKKCKLGSTDTDVGHVGTSMSSGSPTETYQVS